jgi:membrane protein DedA with SNARE-associated domain
MPSLDSLIQLLVTYKYLLLLPVSIVEGPIISIIAGFLCSKGVLSLFVTYPVLIMGDLLGDTMYYSIGRWGGRGFINKWGKIFGIKDGKFLRTENQFKNHGKKTLIFGKTQAMGGVILVAAGLGKMPYLRFIWLNFVTTIVKSFLLLITGYYFGHAYRLIDHYFGLYGVITLLLITFAAIIYFLFGRKKKA